MMYRSGSIALMLCAALGARASAQLPELAGIGYVGLAFGSTIRLLEGDCCATARVGSEVRGTVDLDGRPVSFAGRVVSIDSVLAVESESNSWRFARSDLGRVYVNAGPERQWARGWGMGLVGFGLFGAVAGYASGPPEPGADISLTRGAKTVIGGVVFGVVGSVLGAGFGALVTKVAWKRVDRWDPSAGPVPGRDRK